jgi:hypothetical protein
MRKNVEARQYMDLLFYFITINQETFEVAV